MNTHFDAWLRECAAAGKGGPDLVWRPTRGTAFSQSLLLQGNWTGATMRAQIEVQPDSPNALATFAVSGPSVTTVDGQTFTRFTFSLAAGSGGNSTGILPADADGDGLVSLALLIWLTPAGGVEDFFAGGIVTVLGG